MDSILTSIKKMLGISSEDTSFDTDIIIFINSIISVLWDLGVGLSETFKIVDSSGTWEQLLGVGKDYESAKTYIYLRVRLLFDPPSNSSILQAYNNQIEELGWRLREKADPADPVV